MKNILFKAHKKTQHFKIPGQIKHFIDTFIDNITSDE